MTIARVVRARGNKGEVAAFSFTSQPERLKNVLVNQVPMEVENAWMHGDQLVLKFKGVDSISDAQRLAGAEVTIPLTDRAPAPEGEFYQADLIGCQVVDGTGRLLGLVEDWLETGAAPLIQVRTVQNKELLIPFAKSFLIDIDVAAKRIEVNLPEGLEDLN